MEKRNDKKNPWSRITAMLLIASLMIVLLWGCSGKKKGPPPAIQTAVTEPTALPEAELLDTTAKVVAYVEKMVQAGAEKFSLVCSEEIYEILLKVTYKADGIERKAFHSLLEQAGILEYEKVLIADIDNGQRFETYTIAGERGSGVICLNGATARQVSVGDKIIIMCFAQMDETEAKAAKPKVVFMGEGNIVDKVTNYEKHGVIA